MKVAMLPHEYYKRIMFGPLDGFTEDHVRGIADAEKKFKTFPPDTEVVLTRSTSEGVFCLRCPRREAQEPFIAEVAGFSMRLLPCKVDNEAEDRFEIVIRKVQGKPLTIATLRDRGMRSRVNPDIVYKFIKTGQEPDSFFWKADENGL